jgi:hypothetical protein
MNLDAYYPHRGCMFHRDILTPSIVPNEVLLLALSLYVSQLKQRNCCSHSDEATIALMETV